jgi:hypothetical protein
VFLSHRDVYPSLPSCIHSGLLQADEQECRLV